MLLERYIFTVCSQKVEKFVQKWEYLESDFVPPSERTGSKLIQALMRQTTFSHALLSVLFA